MEVQVAQKEMIRDYSLVGLETEQAIQKGLADAEWYQSPVPCQKMRELLVRKDGPAIRDTLLWFGLIFGSGFLVYWWWGLWLVIFPYVVYSVLYASTSDSRWHESGHGTAFKNQPFDKVWQDMELFGCHAKNKIYTKRNYSMATNPKTEKQLRFNVRISLPPADNHVSAGLGSSYVFNLKPGDEITATGPFGDFHIKQSNREMIYLGGGAGMAPLRSHLSYLFETEKTDRKISFWYGARSVNDLFYQEYFRGLEKKHDNFSFHIALSELNGQDNWKGHAGFIHEVLLNEYLKNHPKPQDVDYYLCGPPAMIKAGLAMLKGLGVDEELVAYDEF